jgi:hypothetical protein
MRRAKHGARFLERPEGVLRDRIIRTLGQCLQQLAERAGSLGADAQEVFGRTEVEGFSGLPRRRWLPLLRAHESYRKFALAANSPVWHASSQRNKNSSNAAGGLSHTWAAVFRR